MTQLVPALLPRTQPLLGPVDIGDADQVLASDGFGGVYWATPEDGGVTDHGLLAGLLDDDHTQYVRNDGRAGGQTITGGTAASDNLTLQSTLHATKGSVILGTLVTVTDTGVGIGAVPTVTNPVHRLLVQQSAANPGIIITGSGVIAGTDNAEGISIFLSTNANSANRQLMVGPSDGIGVPTAKFFRMWFANGSAGLDCLNSAGAPQAIIFGNGSVGSSFGSYSAPPAGVVSYFDAQAGSTTVAFKSNAAQDISQWRSSTDVVLSSIKASGAFMPVSLADAAAPNGTIYYSTTAAKLVFKDSAGVVNALY